MYKQEKLIECLKEERQRCYDKIQWIRMMLPDMPEGYLGFTNKNHYQIIKANGTRTQKMLSRKSADYHERLYNLQLKRHMTKALPVLENNLKFYDRLLHHVRRYDIKAISALLPEHYHGFDCSPLMLDGDIDPADWSKQQYETNPAYPERLIHKSAGGIFTRSKAEAMIATMLEQAGLLFRYEARLQLNSHYIFPDFVILHPRHRRLIYWEHFGMMDEPEYAHKALDKLRRYSQCGFFLGDSLIITWESTAQPLTFQHIEDRINNYLS